jgi:hypothetical protein
MDQATCYLAYSTLTVGDLSGECRVPQRSSRWLAFALAAAYVAVAAIVGIVLLVVSTPRDAPVAEPQPPAQLAPPPSTTTTTQPPTTKPSAVTGFTPVNGPNGVTTVIPKGWALKACTIPDCQQADDPGDPTRFLRLGATASRGGSLFDGQVAYEKEFSDGRVNFQRVKLDSLTHHGSEAVDWEFEYDLNGVRRHVKTLLWRANGKDNWVYASAELQTWPETREVYDKMVASAAAG